MVLGYINKFLLVCFSVICLYSIYNFTAKYSELDKVNFRTDKLILTTNLSKCKVETEKLRIVGSAILKLEKPCFFSKKNNKLHFFSYSDIGVDAVILIVGGSISHSEYLEWGKVSSNKCGNELQSIIIKSNKLYLSDKIYNGVFCEGETFDEKVFWQFAYEK